MKLKPFTGLMALLLCGTIFSLPVNAQKTESESKKEEAKEENKTVFEIPNGDAAELLAFMEKIKQTPPKANENRREYFATVVNTLIETADKVLAAKPDEKQEMSAVQEKLGALDMLGRLNPEKAEKIKAEFMESLKSMNRPGIKKLLKRVALQERIVNSEGFSTEEAKALTQEVLDLIADEGVNRDNYGLASMFADYLSYDGKHELAASFYNKFADAVAESDDARLAAQADSLRGAARQAGLPGNTMEITGTTAKGKEFDWASYRGKVVLVDFWASWCGPCRAEIPNMKKQLANYGPKGFAIVGINLDQTLEDCNKYVKDQGLTWENLFTDEDGKRGWRNPLATYYGVSGIPTAILVDKEGKVISLSARGGTLNSLLKEQLGEPVESKDASEDTGEE